MKSTNSYEVKPKLYQTKYGPKLWLNENDNFFNSKLIHCPYQSRNLKFLKKLVPKSRITLDIGAHVGMNTIEYSSFSDYVYGWELIPDMFELAHKNLIENDIKNAEIFNCGLGEYNGICKTQLQNNNDGLNSVARSTPLRGGKMKIPNGPEVQMKTLDSYELKNIDIIKIDVEGYEMKVLLGANHTIKMNNPILQIEIFECYLKKFGDTAQGIYDFLKERDYIPYNFKGEKLEFEYKKVKRICDTFFIPKSKSI